MILYHFRSGQLLYTPACVGVLLLRAVFALTKKALMSSQIEYCRITSLSSMGYKCTSNASPRVHVNVCRCYA